MTAKVTNLRQARKAKARAKKARDASENALKFGRPKAERQAADAAAVATARRLDGHRREDR